MPVHPSSVVAQPWREGEVVAVERVVRGVIARRVHCREDVDDLVQDAFVRLEAARHTLASSAVVPYAAVVARNLAHSQGRSVVRAAGRGHLGLGPLVDQESVTAAVERADEARALQIAIGHLAPDDRELLVARDVDGTSTIVLAAARGTSPGGLRVRLTRIRAKLRLEFVLTFGRVGDLPTQRCRPVLAAISGADVRRQTALSADDHLRRCSVCKEVALALAGRDRAAA